MRALLLLLLFTPPLFAVDLKDVDRDTLRYVRLALLKDEVRAHFGLRVGEFESLDQALCVKLDGKPLLLLRMQTKAAAVTITTGKADAAGAHLFFEVETTIDAESVLDEAFAAVRFGNGPERTRLLRLKAGALQLCHTWISAEQQELEAGRYIVKTTRRLEAGPKLVETTEYLLDGKRVQDGLASSTTALDDAAEGLRTGKVSARPISVGRHCAIARTLERDTLNEAALHHARAALAQAKADNLAEDDARRLEAKALAAKLEARLRPTVELTK